LDSDKIIALYAALARKLGRLPVTSEMRMHKRENPSFPNDKVFERFGTKQDLIRNVLAFCDANPGNADVAAICAPLLTASASEAASDSEQFETGYVYLDLLRINRTIVRISFSGKLGSKGPGVCREEKAFFG
jgi:hypothetical protein